VIDGDALRAVFDAPAPPTVGIEEEVMLLDPDTLDLAPRAVELLERTGRDERFALELPAAHLEIVVGPAATVGDVIADLARGRIDLAAAARGDLALAGAGLHPFAAVEGELNSGPRYDRTVAEHGRMAHRQLVCAVQVHVAIRGAACALAVHDALRSYLPELGALAANAPLYGGRDTGLASARPPVNGLLPRQGIPPALGSWDTFAEALTWLGDPSRWWWELRPHHQHGTLEIRVPDTQATVADTAAVAAVAHALTVRLAERFAAGEELVAHDTWRIEENRRRAYGDGVEGELRDLRSGEMVPTRRRLHALIDELEPTAQRLGCAAELESARRLVERNGAMAMRAAGDPRGATAWLAERFLDGLTGR
jgi:carboxylate-amine ligase